MIFYIYNATRAYLHGLAESESTNPSQIVSRAFSSVRTDTIVQSVI